MNRLFFNDIALDLTDKVIVSENLQINDFFEIKERNTSYTNKFSLPFTPTNKMAMELLAVAGNNSTIPFKNNNVIFERNGIQTIKNGTAILSKWDRKKGYDINIVFGNNSLYYEINKKKVSELDFGAINHTLNSSNYINSFNHNFNDGYIYGLADFGVFDPQNISINYQVPCLFIKWIWDKIFEEAGYTYSFRGDENVFLTSEFENSVITLNEGYITEIDPDPPVLIFRGSVTNSLNSNQIKYAKLTELSDTENIHSISSSPLDQVSKIRVASNGYYKVEVTGNTSASSQFDLIVQKNNLTFLTVGNDLSGNNSITFNQTVYLSVNDELKIYTKAIDAQTYTIDLNFKISKDSNTAVVNFNNFNTSLTQVNFIKSVMQRFGLIFQKKRGTKEYEFITIEAMFQNKEDAADWSDKYSEKLTEQYKLGRYAQLNFMRYQYDTDTDFSDGSFLIHNETLEAERTLFSSPFKSPRIASEILNNTQLYTAPLFEVILNDDGSLKEIKPLKGSSYIFNVSKGQGSINYSINGGSATSYNGAIPYLNFDQLNFNQIIAKYYSTLASTLQKPLKITATFCLNTLDIYNLDFLKLIYLKQFGAYFYLNKVRGFKSERITKVELIKVNTFENTAEYSDDYSEDYDI